MPKRPQLHRRHGAGGAGGWALAWAGGPFEPFPWQPGTAWTSAGLPVHEVPCLVVRRTQVTGSQGSLIFLVWVRATVSTWEPVRGDWRPRV